MSNPITMLYGSYNFEPVPFITSTKSFLKTPNGKTVGTTYRLSLNGTLVTFSGSLVPVDVLKDRMDAAFSTDGQLFHVYCSGSPSSDIYKRYPRIISHEYSPSQDNWIYTCPYTIELEFDEDPISGTVEPDPTGLPTYISDFTEQWSVEVAEDDAYYSRWLYAQITDIAGGAPTIQDVMVSQFRVSHNISAVGKTVYVSGGNLVKEAWQQARDYVIPRLGFDTTVLNASGVLNISDTGASGMNHVRINTIDETAGSFSVQESWAVIHPGVSGMAGKAVENFVANVRQSSVESDRTSVTVEGSIVGLETRTYGSSPTSGGFAISTTKYDNALGYWAVVQNRLYARASTVCSGVTGRNLHTTLVNKSIGHNPTKGTINYTYEYDNRPNLCIAGALYEDITIIDTYPSDVFAELVILGRAAGPLYQGIGTYTASKKEINIELIYPPVTGCKQSDLIAGSPSNAVSTFVGVFYTDLTAAYGSVWKYIDQESWSPKTGKYSRTIGWTYGACT